jgi:hypothetical protein
MAHYTGAEWENLGQSAIVGSDPGSITVNNVSSFSPVTFGSMSGLVNPLPVRFLSFNAKAYTDSVCLFWSTAFEVDNAGFIMQRSGSDSSLFEDIGWLEGHGNSKDSRYYRFTDLHPERGRGYYRIKQIDFNGNYAFSRVLAVEMDQKSGNGFILFPNPVSRGQYIFVKTGLASGNQTMDVILQSLDGRCIYRIRQCPDGDTLRLLIPGHMPDGVYALILKTTAGITASKVIIE